MTNHRYIVVFVLLNYPMLGNANNRTKKQEVSDPEPEVKKIGFGGGLGLWDWIVGNGPKFCKCFCGRASVSEQARVVGGQYTEAHQYPWLAIVNIQSTTSATGTILNDRYVLTAASQVIGLTPYDVKVTVGGYDRCYPDVTTSNQSVSSIVVHPEFDPITRSNDLALLRLSNTLTTDRWTSPICLPTPNANYQGLVGYIIGWGEGPTAEGINLLSCRPRKVSLPILNDRECLISSSSPGIATRDKGCAGTIGSAPVVCSTDAGGPVQFRAPDGIFELIGVLTDSNVCGSTSGPTFFTKLNAHFSWLFQNTRDSCYCIK